MLAVTFSCWCSRSKLDLFYCGVQEHIQLNSIQTLWVSFRETQLWFLRNSLTRILWTFTLHTNGNGIESSHAHICILARAMVDDLLTKHPGSVSISRCWQDCVQIKPVWGHCDSQQAECPGQWWGKADDGSVLRRVSLDILVIFCPLNTGDKWIPH